MAIIYINLTKEKNSNAIILRFLVKQYDTKDLFSSLLSLHKSAFSFLGGWGTER